MSAPTIPPTVASPAAARAERRLLAGYLAVQAVAGVLLWVVIDASAEVRTWFELVPERPGVTDGFFGADMVVVLTSALAAWGVHRDTRWAVPVTALTAGGVLYPTAYLVGWVRAEGTGSVALAVMVVVTALCGWCAYRVWRTDLVLRAERRS